MKIKKMPYYLVTILLTLAVSIVLGFLSFAGMYALWPILGLAITALVLAMAYEGQIYFQNIKEALNKLFFKRHWVETRLSNERLLTLCEHYFQENKQELSENIVDDKPPAFIQTYYKLLTQYLAYKGKKLNKAQRAEKKHLKKIMNSMEKSFAALLFKRGTNDSLLTSQEKALKEWLQTQSWQNTPIQTLTTRSRIFYGFLAFSTLSGIFMGLGATWLLMGSFGAIPFLVGLSPPILIALIVPMSVVAGVAWGLLTYNSLTNMIQNRTIQKCFQTLRESFKNGLTFTNLFKGFGIILLLLLTIGLTICTAGTWWSVVRGTPALFSWLTKIPNFIMLGLSPIITGISTLVFSVENSIETILILIETILHKHEHKPKHKVTHTHSKNFFAHAKTKFSDWYEHLKQHEENAWQRFNPFRIIIVLTVTPLRLILFLGHLVSIGVTADRFPGIPAILSAILCILTEGFEDGHYFIEHHHDVATPLELAQKRLAPPHGHSHGNDIPTVLIKLCFSPLYLLSALWAWHFSNKNKNLDNQLTFSEAFRQQLGQSIKREAYEESSQTNTDGELIHLNYRVQRTIEKHGDTKKHQLRDIQQAMCKNNSIESEAVQEKLQKLQTHPPMHPLLAWFKHSPQAHAQKIFSRSIHSVF